MSNIVAGTMTKKGKTPRYPTADEIRQAVISRADEFSRLTGKTKSVIGQQAVNDPAFIADVEAGRNITINLYKRFMDWLDDNWPEPSRVRAPAGRKTA